MGRPKGSKNKVKLDTPTVLVTEKRPRGRPRKNALPGIITAATKKVPQKTYPNTNTDEYEDDMDVDKLNPPEIDGDDYVFEPRTTRWTSDDFGNGDFDNFSISSESFY
jgi:hypothetical protein